MATTAKVKLVAKDQVGEDETRLRFTAPYTDDAGNRINEEWAKYTPALSLDMVVVNSVAEQFGFLRQYTLTFTEDDPNGPVN